MVMENRSLCLRNMSRNQSTRCKYWASAGVLDRKGVGRWGGNCRVWINSGLSPSTLVGFLRQDQYLVGRWRINQSTWFLQVLQI